MPRIVGQIDATKTEAILNAASDLFAEKGASASMEAIARRAGVSKQTLYNRYAGKVDIGRALAMRRSDAITAPLRAGGDPQTVLTALAVALLEKIAGLDLRTSMRTVALMSPHAPDIAEAVYLAGPGESLRRLSTWLVDQDRLGTLAIPDPDLAAEMFAGMVLGHSHLRCILDIAHPGMTDIPDRAAETTRRFIRAFAT